MKKLMSWEELKKVVSSNYDVVVTDENLILEDEDCVKLHLEDEVITVAMDIREDDHTLGYELI